MLKETIKYKDYDGNPREETHYFNLTEAELLKFRMSSSGGIEKKLRRIVESQNEPDIMALFSDLIRRSYGVKSDDGRKFMKSDEIFTDFEESGAYNAFFMSLVTDSKKGLAFLKGILPENLADEAAKAYTEAGEGNVPLELLPNEDK